MDHYSTLGVDRNASPDEIKKAYRRLANQHHPDKGGDAAQFQKLQEAYSTLSDPEKKAQYDNPRQHGGFNFHHHGFGDMGDINDMFNQFFGGRSPFHQQNRKQVISVAIQITLQEAYYGVEKSLRLNTQQGSRVVKLSIPKGIDTNNQVQYDDLVDFAVLVVQFEVLQDPKFERREQHLYCKQRISVLDLIAGTTVTVKTISGKELKVNIKPKTQPNSQIRISGEGMPIINTGQYGDQFLIVDAFIPENINQEIINCIENNK